MTEKRDVRSMEETTTKGDGEVWRRLSKGRSILGYLAIFAAISQSLQGMGMMEPRSGKSMQHRVHVRLALQSLRARSLETPEQRQLSDLFNLWSLSL